MKKVMLIAAAVLFSTAMFAQTPQKPAEKKEPAKTEQKSTTASKPAAHKSEAKSTAKPASTTTNSNAKPAEKKKEEAKPMK